MNLILKEPSRLVKIITKVAWSKKRVLDDKLRIHKAKKSKLVLGIDKHTIRSPKIIVSLTSYSKRFDALYLCCKSLLSQTLKPDKVIVYLTEKDQANLTSELLALKNYGLEIRTAEEDLLPHKKYYYAMQEFPDDIVITVDDDVVYDKHLVEYLIKTYHKFPNCITAARARVIVKKDHKFASYDQWKITEVHLLNISEKPSMMLLATGVGGVLYPPHLLNKKILFNKEYIKKFITVDDLWLKAVEILSDIPVVLCDEIIDWRRADIVLTEEGQLGLSVINVGQGRNTEYWEMLDDEFKLADKVVE
ncbi:glycosyltransferase [Lactobacillus delbrueckii subsp. bulgaricus]|uniref:glycosyltransferase n=1 Tax=Lactobacillus delbrueckii TaxID=1584 RepID=UPI003854EFD3